MQWRGTRYSRCTDTKIKITSSDKYKFPKNFAIFDISYQKNGISTVMRGMSVMCTRRGIDWALRFGTMDKVRDKLEFFSGEKKKMACFGWSICWG
jgi:hypothetical protein